MGDVGEPHPGRGALAAILPRSGLSCANGSGRLGFYALFAVTVTASVQLVGVYLVFASLIIPALATRGYAQRMKLPAAYGLGAVGYAVGLAVSAVMDLPSGAVIAVALAVLAIAVAWASPVLEHRMRAAAIAAERDRT